jgi:pimeloyl-ACP methyl ester carboxylesterase
MRQSTATAGYLRGRLPYNRFGQGPRILVVFVGLTFEHVPLSGPMAWWTSQTYGFLGEDYTVYVVNRRPRPPEGYTLRDMADDYATMVGEEFGHPVDVIGVSTGGSICQHFAADHPELLRRLVIHSSAYKLGEVGKDVQLRVADFARKGDWRGATAAILGLMLPSSGAMRYASRPLLWAGARTASLTLGAPDDPSDVVVTIEAEDVHDFKDRLGEIIAPTLVVAGDQDPFYPAELFRETAAGIPNATLALYEGAGHGPSGKHFKQDVLGFLRAV